MRGKMAVAVAWGLAVLLLVLPLGECFVEVGEMYMVGPEVIPRSEWRPMDAKKAFVLESYPLGAAGYVTGFRLHVHPVAMAAIPMCNVSLQVWSPLDAHHDDWEAMGTWELLWQKNITIARGAQNPVQIDLDASEYYYLSGSGREILGYMYGQEWGCIAYDETEDDHNQRVHTLAPGTVPVVGGSYGSYYTKNFIPSFAAAVIKAKVCSLEEKDQCMFQCIARDIGLRARRGTECIDCQCVDVCQDAECPAGERCVPGPAECFRAPCPSVPSCIPYSQATVPAGYYGNPVTARSAVMSTGDQAAYILYDTPLPAGGNITHFQVYIHPDTASHESRLYMQVWKMRYPPVADLKYELPVAIRQGFSGPITIPVGNNRYTVGEHQYLGFTEYDPKGHVSMEWGSDDGVVVYEQRLYGQLPQLESTHLFNAQPIGAVFSVAVRIANATSPPVVPTTKATSPRWETTTTRHQPTSTTRTTTAYPWWQDTTTPYPWTPGRSPTYPWWQGRSTTYPWWQGRSTTYPWWQDRSTTYPWWRETTSLPVSQCEVDHRMPSSTKCPIGTYGFGCGSRCSSMCLGCECHEDRGTCLWGCHGKDYYGPFCETVCIADLDKEECKQMCQGENCVDDSGAERATMTTVMILAATAIIYA